MNNLKQLETREVTVGENIFYIRPLPAFKAANMTGELAALVLPLVSGLAPLLSDVDTEKEGDGLLDIKVEDAAPAIAGAFSSLDGDKVEKILKHLLIAGSNISVEQPGERCACLRKTLPTRCSAPMYRICSFWRLRSSAPTTTVFSRSSATDLAKSPSGRRRRWPGPGTLRRPRPQRFHRA